MVWDYGAASEGWQEDGMIARLQQPGPGFIRRCSFVCDEPTGVHPFHTNYGL